jgi:hypothetical protein
MALAFKEINCWMLFSGEKIQTGGIFSQKGVRPNLRKKTPGR